MIDFTRPFTVTTPFSIKGMAFDGVVKIGSEIGDIPPHWKDQIPVDQIYQRPEPVAVPEPDAWDNDDILEIETCPMPSTSTDVDDILE